MNKNKNKTKPILRGYSHQSAFFLSIGACCVLILRSSLQSKSIIAASVYSLSLICLFGISALYHRPKWKPRYRLWMKKLDHSAIYILIAGTLTPICLFALPEVSGIKLLQISWAAAFVGILQSLFWVTAPKWVSALFYIAVSLLVLPFIPELSKALKSVDLWFFFVGGITYIVGAIIYALKSPNPFPKYFGYHEIFHLFVILGAFFHFLLISNLIV